MNQRRLLYPFIVLALLPLIGLCFYNQPYLDDWGTGSMGRDIGFWTSQQVLYLTWSGRFSSNAFLVGLNPLSYGWLEGVQLTAAVSMVAKLVLLTWAIRSLSTRRISWGQGGWLAASLLVVYMSVVPDKNASVYSFTHLAVYQFPAMLLLLAAVAADRAHRAASARCRLVWWLVTAAAIVGAAAGNEMTLLLTGWALAAGLLASWHRRQFPVARRWAAWVGVWGLSAAIALLAPGNMARVAAEAKDLPALHSLPVLAGQILQQLRYELADPAGLALLALPLLLAPLGVRLLPGRPPGLRFPLGVSAAFLLGGLVLGALPFNLMNYPLERPVNVLYWWLLLGWLAACWASLPAGSTCLPANRVVRLSIGLGIGLLVATTTGRAWQELLLEAPNDARQWQQRYATLRAAQSHSQVDLPPITGVMPHHVLIRGYDIMPYYSNSRNTQMARWFRVDSVRVDPTQLKRASY